MPTDGLKTQKRMRFTTATKRLLRVIIKHLLLQKRKMMNIKFYNFVFDLYVVWLLVF